MLQDYFLEKVEEKPEIKIEELFRDKDSDTAWLEEQQRLEMIKTVRQQFKKLINPDEFETVSEDKV